MEKSTVTTIHQQLKATGAELGGHYSDLYCEVTPETAAIIENYEYKCNVTRFRHAVTGKNTFDIPFANDDFFFGKATK